MKKMTMLAILCAFAVSVRGQTNQTASPAASPAPQKYSLTPNYDEMSKKLDAMPKPAKMPWLDPGPANRGTIRRPRVEYGGVLVHLAKPKKQSLLQTFSLFTPLETDNRALFNEYAHGPGRLLPYALSNTRTPSCILFSASY
jgi:hypothetical protein